MLLAVLDMNPIVEFKPQASDQLSIRKKRKGVVCCLNKGWVIGGHLHHVL